MTTTIVVIIVIVALLTSSITITQVVQNVRAGKKEISQRKTILENGSPAQATINSIRQTNAQLDDQPEVLLDLTVVKSDGEVFHTVVRTVIPIISVPSFQKGSVIEVRYITVNNELKVEVEGAYFPFKQT